MTIADSGASAGIRAYLSSFVALGVHGRCAIKAQNTRSVNDIEMLPQRIVRAQIGTPSLCRPVADVLEPPRGIPLDCQSCADCDHGALLSRGALVAAIKRYLIPTADLLTPNDPEAEQLVGGKLRTRHGLLDAAHELRKQGAPAMLLKH